MTQLCKSAFVLSLGLLLPMSASAAEAERNAPSFTVSADLLQGDKTVRESGEVRIAVAQNLRDVEGNSYRVSLAFADEADFLAATANPFVELDLGRLESYAVRSSSGEMKSFQGSDKAASFNSVLKHAESAVCGDSILRGFTTLPSGVKVGVSLHATPNRIQPIQIPIAKNTLPGVCNWDVFDDCDVFAFGGCGGPYCVITCRIGSFTYTRDGICIEEDVFGPNTCGCIH